MAGINRFSSLIIENGANAKVISIFESKDEESFNFKNYEMIIEFENKKREKLIDYGSDVRFSKNIKENDEVCLIELDKYCGLVYKKDEETKVKNAIHDSMKNKEVEEDYIDSITNRKYIINQEISKKEDKLKLEILNLVDKFEEETNEKVLGCIFDRHTKKINHIDLKFKSIVEKSEDCCEKSVFLEEDSGYEDLENLK